MTWLAQAIIPTTNLGDYAIQIWGSFALVLLLLLGALIIVYRSNVKKDSKIESLQSENTKLLLERIQDAKDFAKLDAQPNEELKKFIGTLFDVYNRSLNDRQGK